MTISDERLAYHQGRILPLTARFGDSTKNRLAYYQVVGLEQDGRGTAVYVHGNHTYNGYQKAYANDVVKLKLEADITEIFNVLMTADRAGQIPDLTDDVVKVLGAKRPPAPDTGGDVLIF